MNIPTIFITGLFAGGLTCLAVQGGLLATSISQQTKDKLEDDAKRTGHIVPVASFLITRLLAYTLLGFILGALGSVVQLSIGLRAYLQIAVGLFMIGTALNLLQVHPIFRYFIIQPPKSLIKHVKNQSKSKSIFGPALLGAFTVLIPCGATQAMMAYAISTGSALSGALTMFIFILGTSPLFFVLGYAAKKLGGTFNTGFNKVAALAILFIAVYNINGALALTGNNGFVKASNTNPIDSNHSSKMTAYMPPAVSEATIYLTQSGYKPDPSVINIKAGSKVKIKLINQDAASCIQAFTVPSLSIQKIVPMGSSDEVEFTVPSEKGQLAFMCSMGMYRGSFNVI